MATKRLTFEEAVEELRSPTPGTMVWAYNYDPNGVPGDWDSITDFVEWDQLARQHGPFVWTTLGEEEGIDDSVLDLGERIQWAEDRLANSEALGLEAEDIERTEEHLKVLVAQATPVEDYAVVSDEACIADPSHQYHSHDDDDPTTPSEALDRLASFIEVFEDRDPSLDKAIEVLGEFIKEAEVLEWGEPGQCWDRIENDTDLRTELGLGNPFTTLLSDLDKRQEAEVRTAKALGLGRHYGRPHCVWCLQAE